MHYNPNYMNSSVIIVLAMRQMPRSTERISGYYCYHVMKH